PLGALPKADMYRPATCRVTSSTAMPAWCNHPRKSAMPTAYERNVYGDRPQLSRCSRNLLAPATGKPKGSRMRKDSPLAGFSTRKVSVAISLLVAAKLSAAHCLGD